MKRISREQRLYELLESIGEKSEGDMHISYHRNETFGFTDGFTYTYRVYHKFGICFDCKLLMHSLKPIDVKIKKTFTFIMHWPGVNSGGFDIGDAIHTVKKYK